FPVRRALGVNRLLQAVDDLLGLGNGLGEHSFLGFERLTLTDGAAAVDRRLKTRLRPVARTRRFGLITAQKPPIEIAKIIANAGENPPPQRATILKRGAIIEPVPEGPGDHIGRP